MLYLTLLEKQDHAKPKTSRRKEIIKMRTRINKIETKKTKESMKQKSGSFEKINKIDKLLANLTKIRRKKIRVNKIRNKEGRSQQTPRKSRESLGTTLKNYTQINWKI
jgi:hypothetical protein